MRQSNIVGALCRRWYVIPIGLALTAGLCLFAVHFVPTTYEAKASVLLLPPKVVADVGGNGGNPFLGLGGLAPAASVLARAMTDSGTEHQLKQRGATGKYAVDPDLSTSGPVLLVVAEDETPAKASRTLQIVLDAAPETLSDLQRSVGAPSNTLLTTSVISQDRRPEEVRKSQIRAVLVAALAGLSSTIFGTALLDGFLRRRAARRGAPGAAEADDWDEVALLPGSPRRAVPTDADDPGRPRTGLASQR